MSSSGSSQSTTFLGGNYVNKVRKQAGEKSTSVAHFISGFMKNVLVTKNVLRKFEEIIMRTKPLRGGAFISK